ncbi:4-alpha-glucanotransferase [Marinobacter persicus]|uniref:4-alpha-glucanotransferase n=1 Tax=Marinobacter persicus TaxID=930118 RepID=UPI001987BC41|nr:4-alpha-glucanotransferase [Marinobacter persicus]GHD47161.1 4-alpha-glucanotransferase [Marinobacter persicus]
MLNRRRAGVLLHPTALPGHHGKLGESARAFVDFLQHTGMTVWQTLPIGPTHTDLSPYQALSAHAGNPDLIDLEELVPCGLLLTEEVAADSRQALLRKAAQRFLSGHYQKCTLANPDDWHHFLDRHQSWLDDFALFKAIHDSQPTVSWPQWPLPLRNREPEALAQARARAGDRILEIQFAQFLFFSQWHALRQYARDRGVLMFGDIPIFVAHDSADVWAHPGLFKLSETTGEPRFVAGVPPDYFSPDGQHWGNPVYDWPAMAADNYRWWVGRLASQRETFDLLRIDHFRGFQHYWEIPAADPRPVNGYWVAGPGERFLKTCLSELPDLPLVAENLGLISDDVEQLRHRLGLPGMTVLQFGFDGSPSNPHLLHNHRPGDLVYTGTHDNDTTLGWYRSLNEHTRHYLHRYLGLPDPCSDMPWPVIRAAMASVCKLAIVPLQDLLGLGSEARFNTPGTQQNNWLWQVDRHALNQVDTEKIKELVKLYGR